MREQIVSSSDLIPDGFINASHRYLFAPSIPDLLQLKEVISDYNTRAFSYPEDALYASAGLSFSRSTNFGDRFVYVLPTALFDLALLWEPNDEIFRRLARNQESKHCLPTWSWAGRSRLVYLPSLQHRTLSGTASVPALGIGGATSE